MSSVDALHHKLDRMIEALPKRDEGFTSTPEWLAIQSIITQEVARYPDADLAVMDAFAEIDRLKHPTWHTIESMIAEALNPYLEARIAIAEKLVSMQQQ